MQTKSKIGQWNCIAPKGSVHCTNALNIGTQAFSQSKKNSLMFFSSSSLQGHGCSHINDKCPARWHYGEHRNCSVTWFILSSPNVHRGRIACWRRIIELNAAEYNPNSTFVTMIQHQIKFKQQQKNKKQIQTTRNRSEFMQHTSCDDIIHFLYD